MGRRGFRAGLGWGRVGFGFDRCWVRSGNEAFG